MSRKTGGFGLLALAIAAAIALLLAASAWKRQGEAAIEVHGVLTRTSPTPRSSEPAGDAADAEPQRAGLPGVSDMQDATSDHSDRLQEALDATNP
jgi:hypothetical protein